MTTPITVIPAFEVVIPRILTDEEADRIKDLSGVYRILVGNEDSMVFFTGSAYTEKGIDLMMRATIDDGEVEWI